VKSSLFESVQAFTWTNLFFWPPLQLPGVVCVCQTSLLQQSIATITSDVFYPPWLLWSSECIGTLAFSICSYKLLFSATQRQKDTSAVRRLLLGLIIRVRDHHLWPTEILGASCCSVPTDKPCSLLDGVFLWCCILVHGMMVIHHDSWWQYVSYQRNVEGVSQGVEWRPETAIWPGFFPQYHFAQLWTEHVFFSPH